jgi:hypothetical protein
MTLLDVGLESVRIACLKPIDNVLANIELHSAHDCFIEHLSFEASGLVGNPCVSGSSQFLT